MQWKGIKKQNKKTNHFSWGGQNKINPYSLDEVEKHNGSFSHWAQRLPALSGNLRGAVSAARIYLCPPAQGAVSGSGALLLIAVDLSGERNLPQSRGAQAAQVLGGRSLCREEVTGFFRKNTGKGGDRACAFRLGYICETPPWRKN